MCAGLVATGTVVLLVIFIPKVSEYTKLNSFLFTLHGKKVYQLATKQRPVFSRLKKKRTFNKNLARKKDVATYTAQLFMPTFHQTEARTSE